MDRGLKGKGERGPRRQIFHEVPPQLVTYPHRRKEIASLPQRAPKSTSARRSGPSCVEFPKRSHATSKIDVIVGAVELEHSEGKQNPRPVESAPVERAQIESIQGERK